MKISLLVLGLAFSYAADWAILLAGSSTYGNYRHQSDTCHSYQIVHKFGIPDERVIVMQYDDIANNQQNPYKGQIFNKPTTAGTPGVDVYKGCKKDYTGSAVTPDMFVAAMTGDASKTGGRPVLKSTASDRVFIFFTDHGGTGIIAFPDGSLMTSTTLISAIKTMYAKKMYSKLVFYMEACESGSMFKDSWPPPSVCTSPLLPTLWSPVGVLIALLMTWLTARPSTAVWVTCTALTGWRTLMKLTPTKRPFNNSSPLSNRKRRCLT